MGVHLVNMDAMLLLERSQPAFWQGFQERMLRLMASHLAAVSPWWRAWFGPLHDRVSLANLPRLPILRRAEFRDAAAGGPLRLPEAHGETQITSTSGSSGMPVSFHVSLWSYRMVIAQYSADAPRHAIDERDTVAMLLSRFPPHSGPHVERAPDPVLSRGPRFERRSLGASMAQHARWLHQLDPGYLTTAPTALDGLLDEWESGLPRPSRLRGVMTVGETVWPALRERTHQCLGLPVLDRYSCEEVGPIALQCPHDQERYHVCVGNVVVEVVDEEGRPCAEGIAGSVLVTGLHHWAAPAIRYELGDVATLHRQCRCGAQVPALSGLLGRKRFLLRLPSGERMFMSVNARHWTDIAPVRQHRLTQRTETDVLAEVVLDRPLAERERAALLAMLGRRSHPAFTFTLQQVDAIAWAPGAKRQDLVSLV